jgi:homoserine O-succinyltransferase/O-acetyltransferase
MPLVAHTQLPTYTSLHQQGHEVLSLERALAQDIRELHIGLLNMMPDAALRVTEQQYMRLIGSCNQIVQFYVHPFTIPGLERSPDVQTYIDTYYDSFEQLQEEGLDALIVTGANVTNPMLELEPFWGTAANGTQLGWRPSGIGALLLPGDPRPVEAEVWY